MLRYFAPLTAPCYPIAMNWEEPPMFTLTDAVTIAADLTHPRTPEAADVAAVLTDGVLDGALPDEPRYHSLARIAARLPERTVRRMVNRLYPEA